MLVPLKDVVDDYTYAVERLNKHLELEQARVARGAETDEERYLAGRETID